MPKGPMRVHEAEIDSAWVDYNGHMNVAYYVLVFDHATDGFLERIGLDGAYRDRTGSSVFVAEMHVSYMQEVMAGERVYVTSQILGHDAKRLHLYHSMHRADDGAPVASNELMILHVDLGSRKVAPFPEDLHSTLAHIAGEHAHLPLPPEAGRKIGIPPRKSGN